jgi:hypothetical protein
MTGTCCSRSKAGSPNKLGHLLTARAPMQLLAWGQSRLSLAERLTSAITAACRLPSTHSDLRAFPRIGCRHVRPVAALAQVKESGVRDSKARSRRGLGPLTLITRHTAVQTRRATRSTARGSFELGKGGLSSPLASVGRIERTIRWIRVRTTRTAEAGSGLQALLEGIKAADDSSTAVVFPKAHGRP